MENQGNLIKRGRGGGCPTRLQKHAPASLEIDKVLNGRPSNPFGEASKAIPFLSPLILSSQQPLYADNGNSDTLPTRTSENYNYNNDGYNEGRNSSCMPTKGWEHPAMASFPEPALCTIFQKQCIFVNQGQ